MTDRIYLTDSAVAELQYVGDETIEAEDIDISALDTTTLETHWTDFFDTDKFVQFEARVAQPIKQLYVHDEGLKTFRKDETELKTAQPQLDNLPWTMDHPPGKQVTSTEQIRGFWDNPYYEDGQWARLNLPANDDDAIRYAVEHGEVSPGFSAQLDWSDDEVDAVQRDMVYDHVASVENGRCSAADGCGIHTLADDEVAHTDAQRPHGHTFEDRVQTKLTEEGGMDPTDFSEGDWVAYIDMEGTRQHGKLASLDGTTARVTPYDKTVREAIGDAVTVDVEDLQSWVGPYADSCPGETCSCGCHAHDLLADGVDFTDAPDGLYTKDGNWYGIAPAENADGEPKYDLNNCNDVKDAYNLRGSGEYDIDESTLVTRIKRAADAHDCPTEQKPWVTEETDTAEKLAHFIAYT